MDDNDSVMLGLTGWASVSITTTICVVWRETLWKVSGRALGLLDLPREEAWQCGSVRERLALGKAFVGDDSGVDDADAGLLELSHMWLGKTFFRYALACSSFASVGLIFRGRDTSTFSSPE